MESGSVNRRQDRQFELFNHGGDTGYYERNSDAHIYDLLGSPLGALDEPSPEDPMDVLVVTAAWCLDSTRQAKVASWLEAVKQEPDPWLTPWRAHEPAIRAETWLDSAAGSQPPRGNGSGATETAAFLVVRLDSPYLQSSTLRVSMDAALDRFDDLRTAMERRMSEVLQERLPRCTRSWLLSMQGAEDEPELDLEE